MRASNMHPSVEHLGRLLRRLVRAVCVCVCERALEDCCRRRRFWSWGALGSWSAKPTGPDDLPLTVA